VRGTHTNDGSWAQFKQLLLLLRRTIVGAVTVVAHQAALQCTHALTVLLRNQVGLLQQVRFLLGGRRCTLWLGKACLQHNTAHQHKRAPRKPDTQL
jgi:hypothetical protein